MNTPEPIMDDSIVLTVGPGSRLIGEVGGADGLYLPGDKSLSHRAALLGAMADGSTTVRNFLVSGVTEAMLNSLKRLGVSWRLDGTTLAVQGVGLEIRDQLPVILDCGNSATTLRLLAGAAAAWGRPVLLDGTPGLRRRPMGRIIDPLRQMGVAISGEQDRAPLTLSVSPRPLAPLRWELPVASAQVKSCLLLAGLATDGETELIEPGPSRDHTERMLSAMGVEVQSKPIGDGRCWTRLKPPQPLSLAQVDLTLPGDFSAASFIIVAALLVPGSQVVLREVGLNPTRTGLLETLKEMGADITVAGLSEQGGEPVGDLIVRSSALRGGRVNGERVVRMIDEFPAFAVAAAYAEGETIVSEAEELRHKESDRITALGNELRRLGVDFRETPDGFAILGGSPIRGGQADSHGDHRLAMSLALVGLASQAPVRVNGASVIQESFPGLPRC